MMYPHNRRLIAKVVLPNFEAANIKMPADQFEEVLKKELSIRFASEFLKNIDIKKVGAVGNEFEIEYVMEAYVFTGEQLDVLIDAAKKSI